MRPCWCAAAATVLVERGVGLGRCPARRARPRPSRRGRVRRRCAGRAAGGAAAGRASVLPIARARSTRPSASIVSIDGERGGAGERVAAVRAAEPADVRRVHHLGAAGHRGQRQPAGDALGGDDQVGHDALVVAREHGRRCGRSRSAPRRRRRRRRWRVHHSASAGRKPGAGTTKPPSPWIGSMTTAARLSAPTCFSITSIARARGGRAVDAARRGTGRTAAPGRPRPRTGPKPCL